MRLGLSWFKEKYQASRIPKMMWLWENVWPWGTVSGQWWVTSPVSPSGLESELPCSCCVSHPRSLGDKSLGDIPQPLTGASLS